MEIQNLESKAQNWNADLNTQFKFQNNWSCMTYRSLTVIKLIPCTEINRKTGTTVTTVSVLLP